MEGNLILVIDISLSWGRITFFFHIKLKLIYIFHCIIIIFICAASSAVPSRRAQVMTGPLPDDFLQLPDNPAPYPVQQMAFGGFHQSTVGILNVTVVQARLAKNYGLTKMDPFCRVRIGVMVFETPTAYNGSKNPRWNRTIQRFDHIFISYFFTLYWKHKNMK